MLFKVSTITIPVQSATDRGKRVVGSKTTYFVLPYRLGFFLGETPENRFEYLANAFNLYNVVRKNIQDRLGF